MRLLTFIALALSIISCTTKKPAELKPGTWRGVIEMQNQQLPFLFDIEKKDSAYIAYLRNDTEKILLDEVSISGDSVTMILHVFDAALKAKIDGDKLTGTYVKNYNTSGNLPFTATFGEDFLFTKEKTSATDFSGKHQVQFFTEKDTS